MEEKWIDNLRNKMESHEESEPLGLWDNIEVALNDKKPSPVIGYRKILLWSATIGSVAAMLALIFLLGNRDSSLLTVPANIERLTTEQLINEPETDKKTESATEQIEEQKSFFATNEGTYSKQQGKQQVSKNDEAASVETLVEDDAPEKVGNDNAEEQQKVTDKDLNSNKTDDAKKQQPDKKNSFVNGKSNYESLNNYNFRKTSKNSGRLTASVYSTNLPNSTGESNGYGELVARTTLPKQMTASGVEEQGPVGDVVFSNIGEESYTNTEHKQPLKAGLSIRYELNDKFGIESGLTYTYLSSKLTSGTSKNLYETEQSLQYIGIPLNVNYNVWENKQLSFYVSAGGLVEKSIAGKSHTDFILNNTIVSTEENDIKESPLQFSVNSSVGIQYNLSSKLGIFAEPGLGYYFDNGSNIETIYKEKPLNLNLKIGIRVNIR